MYLLRARRRHDLVEVVGKHPGVLFDVGNNAGFELAHFLNFFVYLEIM